MLLAALVQRRVSEPVPTGKTPPRAAVQDIIAGASESPSPVPDAFVKIREWARSTVAHRARERQAELLARTDGRSS